MVGGVKRLSRGSGGTELDFEFRCQPPGGSAPLFYLSEKPVETSKHPGIDGRLGHGLLFVPRTVRRTFRAIDNTLTLLFIVVNKPISFE